MSKIKLTGDTSGYVEISAPNVAANNTLELGGGTKILTNLDNVFTGVTTYSGNIDLNANLDLDDNNKILIGTGDDLQIYHDGSHSYIDDTGTGRLNIRGNTGVSLRNYSNSNQFINCYTDGTVELFYNNSKKLETTTTGATVTGTLVSGSVTSELDLSAISSSISDTATNIFVYDTRKDSDGGAWRKRTQHTSWYNETLNTSTRGSRKEFPAVAVIVLGSDFITIYDGDDPDMPMWMKFISNTTAGNSGGSHFVWSPCTLSSIVCKNGLMGWSDNGSAAGWYEANFISEKVIRRESGSLFARWGGNFAQRNGESAFITPASALDVGGIVNWYANDSAMTVLPNAPIDDATGLPVPTIAVATDGGVSVIKDDGTVVDIRRTSDDDVHFVALDGDRVIMFMELGAIYVATIPSADQSGNPNSAWSVYGSYGGNTSGTDHPAIQAYGPGLDLVSMKDHTFATAGYNLSDKRYKGLSILSENVNSSGNGMVAWAHTDFNTGWMNGDIKGAFLSDTDTTNVTGSDLIDNGDFGTGDFTNWSTSGTTTPTISSGGALLTTGAADGAIWQSTSGEATSGKWVITWTVTSNSGGFFGLFLNNNGANGSGGSLVKDSITTSGSYYYEGSITAVEFRHRASSSGIIDNITLRRVEDDRSVNNKGLQVFGTVTKSAVATGADLVAYSGWSSSNYLLQPPNSDLAFGNNAFSVMCWFKTSQDHSATDSAFLIAGDDGSNQIFDLRVHSDEKLLWQVTDDGFTSRSRIYQAGPEVNDGYWHCVVATRTSDNKTHLYLDGNLIGSSTSESAEANLSNSIAFSVGIENAYDGTKQKPWGGSIALTRISESVPSPEQIKKMYNDEKHLFQENAKATLYGSSDAVTALGYDEDTELLHVGTSSGRSDFQGLRRINNTTTAVTTAISASDDLIAEQ